MALASPSRLSSAQAVAVKFFCVLVALVLLAMADAAFRLAESVWAALPHIWAAVTRAAEWAGRNYALLSGALGTLWTISLLKRSAANNFQLVVSGADYAGWAGLVVLAIVYYWQIKLVAPMGQTLPAVAATYAGLCAALFPALILTDDENFPSSIIGWLIGLVWAGVTAGVSGLDTSVVDQYGRTDSTHVPNITAAIAHAIAVTLATLAAVTLTASLNKDRLASKQQPPQGPSSPAATTTPSEVPVSAADTAPATPPQPVHVEETWEQRFARQRALREAERRAREAGNNG